MPTNLPPDYYEIEKRFRAADTTEEKIELLEEMYSVVPKHKGTDHLRADLRRKLARLKNEAESPKSSSKRDTAFHIPRAGAGQAALVGPSGVGKTTLLRALVSGHLNQEEGYDPTFEPVPAMMAFDGYQVQMIDTPPFSRDYGEPRLKDLIRRADLVLLVVDLHLDPILQLQESVALLEEAHIIARHRQARYPADRHWNVLPFLVAVNKCDDVEAEDLYAIFCALMDEKWPCLPVSALYGRGLERLKRDLIAGLEVLRVYTKMPGREPDFTRPFVLKIGSTVEDLAGRIHKDFLEKMKSARVWGKTVFDGQMVPREYVLQDGDVVEIHL